MLETLHISNYALIDRIDIQFRSGLNIITGETGAGKSIMLGALSLLLGARADSRVIRNHQAKSIIECQFDVSNHSSLRRLLAEADIEWPDDNRCILRREISPAGRSRSFINDSVVTLAQLQSIGLRLIDIHSQHQNQLLADPEFQRSIIDALAGNQTRLADYTLLYTRMREAIRRLKATRRTLERDADNAEFMQFQLAQLDKLNLIPGELAELQRERDLVADSANISTNIAIASDLLSEGNQSVLDMLAQVQDACIAIENSLDPDEDIIHRLDSATIELSDIATTLSSMRHSMQSSPERLDDIDSRISDIHSMMARHHVDSDTDLINLRDSLRTRIDRLADSETIIADIEREARHAHKLALAKAREISQARKDAAALFAEKLRATAMPLGMKNLVVEIDIAQADISATGIDNVEFRFAFNKNQTPIPVSGAASGGEISRLMLSIKSIIAHTMQLPSIIFDEVDTGVSGDVAARMGAMMQDMSSSLQVIAITHLPQVAAKGATHYKVFKEDDENSTHTRIAQLTPDRRIDEIALMLSGDSANPAARANAISLLENK